jgi:formyl-CoA transferase
MNTRDDMSQEAAGAPKPSSPREQTHNGMGSAARSPLPLAGLRVLELGTLVAGPYAASVLAQFGAEVIKIESPGGGDPLRSWRRLHKGTSLWWYTQSRNKQSVTVNLRDPRGQQIVRDLAAGCDVVIENFRPGTLEKWGLGWDTLAARQPALIMVRVSGYGQSGPYRDRPGFAAIAESIGGLRYVAGHPDRPPVRTGISLGDTLASLYGVIGALLALHHLRAHPGQGQFIDVALYESVFGVMESLLPEYSAQGFVRERSGASLPGIAPSNTYPCGDGRYIIIAGNTDSIYRRLMQAVGRADLAQDPELAGNAGRARQADRIDTAITEWTMRRSLEAALATLEAAQVPCGPIYTAADIATDPHYRARGMLETHALPDGLPVEFPGIVPRLSATPGRTRWLGPRLGEHTQSVLGGLGLDQETLDTLRREGVI